MNHVSKFLKNYMKVILLVQKNIVKNCTNKSEPNMKTNQEPNIPLPVLPQRLAYFINFYFRFI